MLVERGGDVGVQVPALRVVQLLVGGLAQQRVAERVEPGRRVVHEHGAVDRLAQGGQQLPVVDVRRHAQQLVVDRAARAGDHAQHLLRARRERLDAQQQAREQPALEPGAGGRPGGGERLDEERHALGALEDLALQLGRRRAAKDRLEQRLDAVGRQRADLERLDPQLVEQESHVGCVVELLLAHRHHGPEALLAQVMDQEAQEVARGRIGPLQVLDHEQDGRGGGELAQQREQRAEQARLREVLGDRLAHRTRVGDQVGEDVRQLAKHPARNPESASSSASRSNLPQRGADRRVGDLGAGYAVSGQHQRSGRARPGADLAHEPRLADPGRAGDDHVRRLAVDRTAQDVVEQSQLGRPVDQAGARHPRARERAHVDWSGPATSRRG